MMEWARIQYSGVTADGKVVPALSVRWGKRVALTDVHIMNSFMDGLVFEDSQDVLLTNSSLRSNPGTGVRIVRPSGRVTISDVSLAENGDGLVYQGKGAPYGKIKEKY